MNQFYFSGNKISLIIKLNLITVYILTHYFWVLFKALLFDELTLEPSWKQSLEK